MPLDQSGGGGGNGGQGPGRSLNVLGGELALCSAKPMTGFFRNGCCDTRDHAEADLLTPGPAPPPSPTEVAVVRVEPVARLEAVPRGSVVPSVSPPPTVLRI